MPRHDIYPAPSGAGYLLDIQADLLDALNTRVVVPLLPKSQAPAPANRLNPVFSVEGQDVVMVSQFLSAVPVSVLGKSLGNLSEQADEITAAIDMVTQGF